MSGKNQFGPDNPWSDRARALARKHHAEGLSAGESAQLLGEAFNRNMVVGFRHRAGLKVRPKSPPPPPPKPPPKPKAIALPPSLPAPRPLKPDGAPPETARPWETRTRRECCWPVGKAGGVHLYCCARITEANDQGWCETHALIGYSARAGTVSAIFRPPGLRRA